MKVESIRAIDLEGYAQIEIKGDYNKDNGDILVVIKPLPFVIPKVGIHVTQNPANIGFELEMAQELLSVKDYSYYNLYEIEIDLNTLLASVGCLESQLDTFAYQLTVKQAKFTILWAGKVGNCAVKYTEAAVVPIIEKSQGLTYIPTSGYHSKITLPADRNQLALFYVTNDFIFDRYEIKRLEFPVMVKVLGKVDLEVGSEHKNAKPFIVTVAGNSTIKLPFHLRYQPPGVEKYKPVDFSGPIIVTSPSNCQGFVGMIPEFFKQQNELNDCLLFTKTNDSTFRVPIGDITMVPIIASMTKIIVLLGLLMIFLAKIYKRKAKTD